MTISKELREAFEEQFGTFKTAGKQAFTQEHVLSFIAEREEKLLRDVVERLRKNIMGMKPILHSDDPNRYLENVSRYNTLDDVLALLPQTLVEKK